ncbi:MAG TPA: hypothetical protein PLK80_18635, partial [bacterium]|nr:hypothetical protein [bacterium]
SVFFTLAFACRAFAETKDYAELIISERSLPLREDLASRVGPAPESVIKILSLNDKIFIQPDKPYRARTPAPEHIEDIRAAIDSLPPVVRETAESCLLGIYFVENLIGSGLVSRLAGPDYKEYFIIAINPETLDMNASEWITKKEKTAFIIDDSSIDVSIDIGADRTGLYYIFYHEIAHVFDYAKRITQGEEKKGPAKLYDIIVQRSKPPRKKLACIDEFWESYSKPARKYDFDGRDGIVFYRLGGPNTKISEATALYRSLSESPFATLYASMNWMDDFAELFAMWMSVENLGRPWRLTLSQNGDTLFSIYNPLKSEPLAARVGLMKSELFED